MYIRHLYSIIYFTFLKYVLFHVFIEDIILCNILLFLPCLFVVMYYYLSLFCLFRLTMAYWKAVALLEHFMNKVRIGTIPYLYILYCIRDVYMILLLRTSDIILYFIIFLTF